MSAPNAPKKPRRNSIDNVTPVCTQKCGNHDLDGSMDDVQDIIFYVKLDVDNDLTAEEADLHVKTFQMLEDSKANPVWLPEDECMRISRNDPNFFFLPVFRGKVFNHLKSLNVKVYSSFLVRQLLYNGGCLPKWTHPVYSLSMSGSVICFTGLPSAKRAELTDLIHYMNGVVSKALHEKVTHLVTEKCDSTSNKYTEARRLRLPVMSPVWIEDGWRHATKFSKDDITSIEKRKPYILPIFSQMLLTSSGVVSTERSELIRLIEVNGGKFQGDMKRDSCTHLITDKTIGDKYRKAREWGSIQIVKLSWVRKSVDAGYILPERAFDPEIHNKCSTPVADARAPEELDFSVIPGTGGRLNTSTVNTQLNRIENADNTLSRTPLTALRYNTLKRDPNKRRMEPPPNCVDPTDILEETYLRGDFDFLEGCMIWLCGIDEKKMERWKKVLDRSGATRVSSMDAASHIVVLNARLDRPKLLRAQARGVNVLRAEWIVECFKKKDQVAIDEFLWDPDNTVTVTLSEASVVPTPSFTVRDYIQAEASYGGRTDDSRVSEHRSATVSQRIDGGICGLPMSTSGSTITIPMDVDDRMDLTSENIEERRTVDVTDKSLDLRKPFKPKFNLAGVSEYIDCMPSPDGTEIDTSNDSLSVSKVGLLLKEAVAKTGRLAVDTSQRNAIHFRSNSIPVISERINILPPSNQVDNLAPREENIREKLALPKNDKLSGETVAAMIRMREQLEKRNLEMAQKKRQEDKNEMGRPISLQPICSRSTRRKRFHEALIEDPPAKRIQIEDENDKMPIIDWEPAAAKVLSESEIQAAPEKLMDNSDTVMERVSMDSHLPSVSLRQPSSFHPVVTSVGTTVQCSRRTEPPLMPLQDPVVKDESVSAVTTIMPEKPWRKFIFTSISSYDRERLSAMIVQLGAIADGGDLSDDCTHLICGKLIRGSKLMGCIASGKWVVGEDYVIQSAAAGRWLQESEFEWSDPTRLCNIELGERELKLAQACRRWRLKLLLNASNRRGGAFSNWRCLLYCSAEKARGLIPLLDAGGATAINRTSSDETLVAFRPTHAIVCSSPVWNQRELLQLVSLGTKVFQLDYISRFLLDDVVDEECCYHPDYKRALQNHKRTPS